MEKQDYNVHQSGKVLGHACLFQLLSLGTASVYQSVDFVRIFKEPEVGSMFSPLVSD